MLLLPKATTAQTYQIVENNVRLAFEGTWQEKEKQFINTIKIHFEPGEDDAIFTDVGNGVAPSKTFKVSLKGNRLVLPVFRNQNDYLEMEVKKWKLYLRTMPGQWDSNGMLIRLDIAHREQKIFIRIEK
ncbi:MAG: hypothetical protein BGO31_07600 [Bacteroidetes bacterium 43-16]|nr:MAG: hypothetical protein BGO31_07600 [Bacteroidetes bacterium 43-16]